MKRAWLILPLALAGCTYYARRDPDAALTKSDILVLRGAGVSDTVIAEKIKTDGVAMDLTPEEILDLKKTGISDKIITAMLEAKRLEQQRPAVVYRDYYPWYTYRWYWRPWWHARFYWDDPW